VAFTSFDAGESLYNSYQDATAHSTPLAAHGH